MFNNDYNAGKAYSKSVTPPLHVTEQLLHADLSTPSPTLSMCGTG